VGGEKPKRKRKTKKKTKRNKERRKINTTKKLRVVKTKMEKITKNMGDTT
jgi:hypothetical protein